MYLRVWLGYVVARFGGYAGMVRVCAVMVGVCGDVVGVWAGVAGLCVAVARGVFIYLGFVWWCN